MAEITKEKEVTVEDTGKTPEVSVEKTTTIAPVMDETTEAADDTGEAPESEDISDIIALLNIMDQESGGTGEIQEVPAALKGSIKFLIDKLIFVRDMFEDPLWKKILDDMADQKEDGSIPSIEVAIARTIPLDKLQELADSEDYEGAQTGLADNLAKTKSMEDEDAMYEENFNQSQAAGEKYAARMGYDEERKNALFQKVLDLFRVMGDGKLTEKEFEEVDMMLNYKPDTEALRDQIGENPDPKEVLPDKASVEAAMTEGGKPIERPRSTGPGLESLSEFDVGVDVTDIGRRKRKV